MVKASHASRNKHETEAMHQQEQSTSDPGAPAFRQMQDFAQITARTTQPASNSPSAQDPTAPAEADSSHSGLVPRQHIEALLTAGAAPEGAAEQHLQQHSDSNPNQTLAQYPDSQMAHMDVTQGRDPAEAAAVPAADPAAEAACFRTVAGHSSQHDEAAGTAAPDHPAAAQAVDVNLSAAEVLAASWLQSALAAAGSAGSKPGSAPGQNPMPHPMQGSMPAVLQYQQYGGYLQHPGYPQQDYEQQVWFDDDDDDDWQGPKAKRPKIDEYYRQKLAQILQEANREPELPQWGVKVTYRPKTGKPDAYYIGPDGTRYKSRAILREKLGLPPRRGQ